MATGTLITHQISAQCTQQFPRHGKGVRTCARADAPHPWLVESTLLITPNPNTKFEHHRPSHSRDAEARCARAHVQRYTTHDLWKAHSSWPTTHSPNSNTIGQAVPEIQKRGVHVRTCRRRYPARIASMNFTTAFTGRQHAALRRWFGQYCYKKALTSCKNVPWLKLSWSEPTTGSSFSATHDWSWYWAYYQAANRALRSTGGTLAPERSLPRIAARSGTNCDVTNLSRSSRSPGPVGQSSDC